MYIAALVSFGLRLALIASGIGIGAPVSSGPPQSGVHGVGQTGLMSMKRGPSGPRITPADRAPRASRGRPPGPAYAR